MPRSLAPLDAAAAARFPSGMRRAAPLALLASVASWATATAAARADALAHDELRLANGLRVFTIVDHRAPTAAVVTWYRVGSAAERPGKTGLAHLFEHLMFKGSPGAADGVMDKLVEEQGGWTNADTERDRTLYVDLATGAFVPRALWLEADRLEGLARTLDQAKLDNQRDVVLNERRETHENQPYGMAGILIDEALWPKGHPYHAPIIGYPEDLRGATVDDARAFFRTHYVPANAVMVVAGDVDAAAVRAAVDQDFGGIAAAPAPPRPAVAAPPPIDRAIVLTAEDNVQVPRLYLTWRGVAAFSADEPALELLTAMLAGGKSSRLYRRLVVEERLAQDVFAGNQSGELGGMVQIVATAKPGVDPARIQAAVDEELAKVGEPAELERARNVREAGFLAGLAGLAARAELLLRYAVLAGDPDYLARDLARFRAVAAADARRVVGRYLGPQARVVLTIAPRGPHAP
jgi:zinc protease